MCISIAFSPSGLHAQRTSGNTYFHVFLHPKFASSEYRTVGLFTSMDSMIVSEEQDFDCLSPSFNHSDDFRYRNDGDKEFQKVMIATAKEELERLGYEVVVLNPFFKGASVTMENLFDLGSKEHLGALCIVHYNVFDRWVIKTDSVVSGFWMAFDEDPRLDVPRRKNYVGYLVMPNLYLYDIATRQLMYRGLNYGNNGEDEDGFYLSDQSDPFWKGKAAERAAKTIFNYGSSGLIKRYPNWEHYSIPGMGIGVSKSSPSPRDENDFWIRSMSVTPYAGVLPMEVGFTLNKVWDPGTHVFSQLSFSFARTMFTPDISVFGLYVAYDTPFKSGVRNLERFSTRWGIVFGGALGAEQTYTEERVTTFPYYPFRDTFVSTQTSSTGRLLLALSFHGQYLVSRSLAVGLRVSPGLDVHFYYPDRIRVNVNEEGTNEQIGIAQQFGIPILLNVSWYFQ